MTCAELNERLVDYLYEELSPGERQQVESHLSGCPSCQAEVSGLGQTLGRARLALRGPLAEEAPARVRADVLAAAVAAVASRPVVQAAAPAPTGQSGGAESFWSFWSWLKKPWFLPAFAAVSALAIFAITRPALMKPLPTSMDEAAGRAEEPAAPAPEAPSASGLGGVLAAEPSAAAPAGSRASQPADLDDSARRDRAAMARPRSKRMLAEKAPLPRAEAETKAGRGARAEADGQMRWGQGTGQMGQGPGQEPARPAAVAAPVPKAMVASKEAYDLHAPVALESATAQASAGASMPSERKGRVGAAVGGGAPAREAPASASNFVTPPPAAPAAAPPAAASPPPAAAGAPAAAAPSAAAEAVADDAGDAASRPAQEIPATWSQAELQRRAELASREGRHAEAARFYRELLRRFPGHRDAPQWRRRLEAASRAVR